MTQAQDLFSHEHERKSMNEAKSKAPVSTASSRTSFSESPRHFFFNLEQTQVFPTETPSLSHVSNTLSPEKLESSSPGTFDLSEFPLSAHSPSPEQKEQSKNPGLAKPIPATQDYLLCQTAQESSDDQVITSSESTPTPPKSGSPQLDQLLSDLEAMNLTFRTKTPDPLVLEFSDESSEGYQVCDFSPGNHCRTEQSGSLGVSVSSATQLAEATNDTRAAVLEPTHVQTSEETQVVSVTPDRGQVKAFQTGEQSIIDRRKDSPLSPAEFLSTPERPQTLREVMVSQNSSFPVEMFESSTCVENATLPSVKSPSDIAEEHLATLCEEDSRTDILESREKLESAASSQDSMGVTGGIATLSIQDELTHLWEVTFVEATQTEDVSSQSLSDLTPNTVLSARQFSFEELMAYPSPGTLEVSSDDDRPKARGQRLEESLTPRESENSSTSDEEYSIPSGYADISSTTTMYTHKPPEYAEVVHGGADGPSFEHFNTQPFFDCIQAASDESEADPGEPEASARSNRDTPEVNLCHVSVLQEENPKVRLSSGSEDYDETVFVLEPPYNVHEEKEKLRHPSSDEEFSLCETSTAPPVCEIGEYDDAVESRTSRADEMPDLSTQSVTKEKYQDENGHVVVKKVTRTVLRTCVSADGVERAAGADGHSEFVKRTVLKSEGDHAQGTFSACEGFSASSRATAEGCKGSGIERTKVVEGERTKTQQGDPSLASDLPSAQKDFKQDPHA